MKSIQSKILMLILTCVFLTTVVIGGSGIRNAQRTIDQNSSQIMNLTCSEKAAELNYLLLNVEQSVRLLASQSLESLPSLDELNGNIPAIDAYTDALLPFAINVANNTTGAVAVYLRLNPEFSTPTSGFFWSRKTQNGAFEIEVPTDLSAYSPTDTEHVGWYYIPIENQKPTWIEPYWNKNIDVQMISFVIPLYAEGQTVGLVGIDIDFNAITDSLQEMRAYENGYAFLVNNKGEVMFHHSYPMGIHMADADSSLVAAAQELKNESSGNTLFTYLHRGVEKRLAFRTLVNDMRLVLTAPADDIDATRNALVLHICIAALIISIAAVIITVILTRAMIRPLKELNEAAKKIADGDFGVTITAGGKDEVGTLANSFRLTVNHLQTYISYINGLAYRDGLTGARNKTAYEDKVTQIEDCMRITHIKYGVVVFDLNHLKRINDSYGHDFGDMYIINCCKIICQSFPDSPVYRIGGDEFVVILEANALENCTVLLRIFERNVEVYNRTVPAERKLSIAKGVAIFDYKNDLTFLHVFKRADEAMYQNKAYMKSRKHIAANDLSDSNS